MTIKKDGLKSAERRNFLKLSASGGFTLLTGGSTDSPMVRYTGTGTGYWYW